MSVIYPRFLHDKSEYGLAELYWENLWKGIAPLEQLRDEWRPRWFAPRPIRDGNPIFTAISTRQAKAVRIIQYDPEMKDIEFDWWLDTYGEVPLDPSAIRELVIACILTPETSTKAADLMKQWVSFGEIRRSCNRYGVEKIEAAIPQSELANRGRATKELAA